MRVVLNTNVIVSSFLTPQGRVAMILNPWEQNVIKLVVSKAILGEYDRVLHYPRHRRRHRLTDEQLEEVAEAFLELAALVVPDEMPNVIENDPDDNHFLAAANAGRADCIVSGDPHLLDIESYEGIPIHSPAEFLKRYFPESTSQ